MGRSEWGVLVRSKEDVRRVLAAAQAHNDCEDADARGEDLTVPCLLNFHGMPFLCLSNGGGRSYTNRFLWERLPDVVIFWALSKPPGWMECQDYMWQVGEDEASPLPQDVPVDTLPLPEAAPAEPLPEVPAEVRSWLVPTKPFDQFDMGTLLFGHPDAVGMYTARDPATGRMVQTPIMRGDRSSFLQGFLARGQP